MTGWTRGRGRVATVAIVTSALIPGGPVVDAGGASRAPEPVRVVADGLFGPFGLGAGGGRLYVAEFLAGQITQINPNSGGTRVVAEGLASPQGVDRIGRDLAVLTGGAEVPDPEITEDSLLLVGEVGGDLDPLADLERFELRNNPDGQRQFDRDGNPLDALSNPFSVVGAPDPEFVYVADAGANAVLKVNRDGRVRRFFVPPIITTGECEGRPNNDRRSEGCDPVPTGLAYGPDNTLYVSGLAGEAPGEGRIYVVDATTGRLLDEISGFDGPTGVAVAPDGTVYVSELLANFNPMNPEDIGRIVRVAPDGTRTYAQVTQPLGLLWLGGKLYSTANSVSFFFGPPDLGQVVEVRPNAFSSSPS